MANCLNINCVGESKKEFVRTCSGLVSWSVTDFIVRNDFYLMPNLHMPVSGVERNFKSRKSPG